MDMPSLPAPAARGASHRRSWIVLLVAWLCSGPVAAQVIEYAAGITASAGPRGIAAGPDGNVWFTEETGNRIGRITPDGVITEFSAGITASSGPIGIIAGPDGALWFTEFNGNRIGRITTAGVVTEFPAGTGVQPTDIAVGADNNLWFTKQGSDSIGRITTAGVVTIFTAGITAGGQPTGITDGPDGNLWFTQRAGARIGRITTAGVVTEFSTGVGSQPHGIVAGPDGALWYGFNNGVGRITVAGVATQFTAGVSAGQVFDITRGSDGNLYYTHAGANKLGQITPAGAVMETNVGISGGAALRDVVTGKDGHVWMTELSGNRIGRLAVPGAASYNCNGDINNSTGPGRHLTPVFGVPVFSNSAHSGRSCQFGGATKLSANGFVASPTASYSFWYNKAAGGGTQEVMMQSVIGNESTNVRNPIDFDLSGGLIRFWGPPLSYRAATAPLDGNWHHVVITTPGVLGQAKIYIDGTLRASTPSGSQAVAGDLQDTFYLGSRSDLGSANIENFNGLLDDVFVTTGVMTASEVLAFADVPGLGAVSDTAMNEDQAGLVVPFNTFDLATPTNSMTPNAVSVTANSTNPALLPVGNIAIQPSGTNRVATLTPMLDQNGTVTVTLTAMDGDPAPKSASTSFTLTVNPVNDPPSFTLNFLETSLEDGGARTVPNYATAISRGGGVDEAGQTLSFIVNTNNPALFAVPPAISPGGTLTYTAAPNANGSATLSVQLMDSGGTANGGSNLSPILGINLDVIGENDSPVFTKGADQTVNEDAPAQAINGWATGVSPGGGPDEAGQTLSFVVTANTNPGLFASGPSVNAAGRLDYTLNPDVNGFATVSLRLDDSGGGPNAQSAVQTFTVTVLPVDDPPSFTLNFLETSLEDAGPRTVPNYATAISRGGGGDETGQTLSFIVNSNNPALFTVPPAISPTGTLTYTAAPDAAGSATLSVQLMDSGSTANGGSNLSPTLGIGMSVLGENDTPVFTKGVDQNINEDAPPQAVNGWATGVGPGGGPDEAGQTLSFVVTGNSNPGLFASGPGVTPAGRLDYTLNPDAKGTATITLRLDDDGGGPTAQSATQSFDIVVLPVNDAPSFTLNFLETSLEDAGPRTVPNYATAISRGGGGDESGQTLSFIVNTNNPALFSVPPAISPTGTLTYTAAPNAAGSASLSVQLLDDGGTANGGSDASPTLGISMSVLGENDPPVFTKGADQTVSEDAPPQAISGWATGIGPGGGADEAGQTLSFTVTANSNPALFAVAPSVSPTGQLSYVLAANANGTASISLQLDDNVGFNSLSPVQTFNIAATAINDPPVFLGGPDLVRPASTTSAQTVSGFATGISDGDPEVVQALGFNLSNDNTALFAAQPQISATGTLSFTLSGQLGVATVAATLVDDATAGGPAISTAPDVFTITAQGTPVTTVVQRIPTATVVGQPFDVRVRVNNPNGQTRPTGNVQVRLQPAGNTVTCTLSPIANPPSAAEALCTGVVAPLAAGKLVQASYAGDAVFFAASGSDVHTVGPASTRLTIVGDSPDPSESNTPVTLQYLLEVLPPSLSPASAVTGQIRVDDGQNQFSAPLNVAMPSLTIHPVGSGNVQLTASYAGDANFLGSSDTEAHALNAVNSADVAVSISNGRTYLDPASETTYVVQVRNLGSLSSTAQLDAPVPVGLGAYRWDCTATAGSSCQSASGTGGIVAALGLAPGGLVSYNILAVVAAPEGSQVNNAVQITPSGNPPDGNASNDSAVDSDQVGMFANGFEGP